MSTEMEIRSELKALLYDLKMIELANDGFKVKGLNLLILRTESRMLEEDVALVEKKVKQAQE